jgi:hypothetical protein
MFWLSWLPTCQPDRGRRYEASEEFLLKDECVVQGGGRRMIVNEGKESWHTLPEPLADFRFFGASSSSCSSSTSSA